MSGTAYIESMNNMTTLTGKEGAEMNKVFERDRVDNVIYWTKETHDLVSRLNCKNKSEKYGLAVAEAMNHLQYAEEELLKAFKTI